MVIWSPGLHELQDPLLRRFAECCERWMDEAGRVRADAFDRTALDGLSQWLMIVEPTVDGFVYSHYGQAIVDHYGRDMTGESSREIGGHISQFFEALYVACARRREWVLSEHEPPKSVFVRSWRRLIVPLFDADDETVLRFAVLNVPERCSRRGRAPSRPGRTRRSRSGGRTRATRRWGSRREPR